MMSMFGMTDEMKSLLVQEIYQRPLLWKPSDPLHTDVEARWMAYEEVAHAISNDTTKFSSDMVKMAWKNMLDYYNHIQRRNERARAAGITPPETKWHFYNMLHFLKQEGLAMKRKYNWSETVTPDIGFKGTWMNSSDYVDDHPIGANDYCDDGLPRPIAIRPRLSDQSECRIRTKQSEKQKLQARREAIRDANLNALQLNANSAMSAMSSGEQLTAHGVLVKVSVRGDIRGPCTPNNGLPFDDSIMSNGTNDKNNAANDLSQGGHKVAVKRLSLSPSPGTSVNKHNSPSSSSSLSSTPKKSTNKSLSPVKKRSRLCGSTSQQQQQRRSTNSESMENVFNDHSSRKQKGVSTFDSASYFARGIAARLFMIKEVSSEEYANICEKINEILQDAENALNI